MAVELEALAVGRLLEPVEMLFEIGNPVFRVELHRHFQVAHSLFIHGNAGKDKGPIARCRGAF